MSRIVQDREIPEHLSEACKKWCRDVLRDYELEQHGWFTLIAAAEAWDDKEAARKILAVTGFTYTDRFNCPKPRPEVAIVRDSRIAFARLVRELGLPVGEPEAPRSPRVGGKQ